MGKGLKRYSPKHTEMANKRMKRCSIIRGMQSKTAVGHHLTPIRMTIRKTETETLREDETHRDPPPGGGKAMWCSRCGKVCQSVKRRLTAAPEIPVLGVHPREMKTYTHTQPWRRWCSQQPFQSNTEMEATQMPIQWGMDKQTIAYPYNGRLLGHKNEVPTDVCYNMGGLWKHDAK